MPLSNKNLLLPAISLLMLTLLTASCAKRQARIPINKQKGIASWYGPRFHGRKTASGERYDQKKMTAAHRKLPFGTWVKVINLDNMKSVIVRINDRGPFHGNRIIDVSKAAAKELDFVGKGTAPVLLFFLPEKDEMQGAQKLFPPLEKGGKGGFQGKLGEDA